MFFSHIGSVIIFYFNKFSLSESLISSFNLSKGVSMIVLLMTIAKAENIVNQKMFSLSVLIGITAEIFYTVLFKNGYRLLKKGQSLPPT